MSKEFIGNSANLYLLPITKVGKGGKETDTYQPMAELVLMTIEADYVLDEKFHIAKSQRLEHTRMHISLDNLGRYIEKLSELRQQMEDFAIRDEQERSGMSEDQLQLPM
jgi:hypothetical protein